MKFTRLFTIAGTPIENQIQWKTVESKILASDGSTVFHMPAVEVPEPWSQTATDILAQKYFRKAGVPSTIHGINEENVPSWLQRREANPGSDTGPETSAKGVFNRLAGAWTYWGWKEGYFQDTEPSTRSDIKQNEEFAKVFYDELYWMLANQMAAPNSPQWFNTGLWWAYGIEGPDSGQWITQLREHLPNTSYPQCWCGYSHNPGEVPPSQAEPEQIHNSYSRPQVSACYIQPVADDLVNPGGIMDLWTKEVRLFKHGAGTGTNFSAIRAKGESLSGGGQSSGLMSFLRIGDVAAGAIKSGGTTRRAAKMCVLDLDHPEIEAFINWKVAEDTKARALVAAGYSPDEAVETISGQNSNNSVRVADVFLKSVDVNGQWALTRRTDGETQRVLHSADLWNSICRAAHACGDPGVQFHDTIQLWRTCPVDGAINASNPCGEYLFLDATACNLASLNLVKFLEPNDAFQTRSFEHAVRLWTTVLDISVSMASYPSAEIALGSYNYRTLGLGYANLGGLLMRNGIAYDSPKGCEIAADITRIMHTEAYKTSAEIARELGPFPRWKANRMEMERVIERHGIIEASPFRNAQVSLIAPTGTIALLMDCATTGIEPAFALRTHKKLAGGGSINTTNQAVEAALQKLGYTPAQIGVVTAWIETGGELADMPSRNGQPFIDPEHLPIFATAVGKNALSPEAHVRMVAAVQPFLSGGVSKTINMPASATVADVDKIYRLAHKLGLKSISIYRDGSKVVQPLSTVQAEEDKIDVEIAELRLAELRGTRLPLPARRSGYTHKLKVDDRSIYLRTGEYPNGSLGEIFVTLSREGSTVRSLMECFSKAVSIGIQYGVPLDEFVEAFIHSKFEPAGIVLGHTQVKFCSSIVDLIFRDLGINYLQREELGQIKDNAEQKIDTTDRMKKGEAAKSEQEPIKWGSLDICWDCGNATLIRAGSCVQCTNCGANSGCG